MKVSLLTGGGFKSYSLSMLQGLVSRGIDIDFIGNDEMSFAEIVTHENVKFFNLRGDQNPAAPVLQKIWRILRYYFKLFKYTSTTDSRLFHIQALNKFVLFDRTILNLYYKLIGKKLVLTAHNIDAKERDGRNSKLNKLSLKILYNLMDHIFVHTGLMKSQLSEEYEIPAGKITVIPHGILGTIPRTSLTKFDARKRLEINNDYKVLLSFGNIAPYKGLEYLIYALDELIKVDDTYRLIVAGQIKGCQSYWQDIENIVAKLNVGKYIIKFIKYIPDDEVEVLFMSSDVLILPYKFIFQSGVPFLSYNFGLPVIATDVGSLRENIVEGETGMVCLKEDSEDLSDKIAKYFQSNLYKDLEGNRSKIITYGNEKYSWDGICTTIKGVYETLL